MANFLKSLFVKGVEIDTASATAGKVLTYDGTKFAPATPGSGSLALDDLSDAVITTPEEFQGLIYNGTSWVNSYTPVSTYVRNAEATTLTTGTCVYLFGATGDHASVKRADNNSDTTSSKTIGVVGANITASNNGPVVTRGYVDGINLSTGYTAGDILWLGENGAFTTTKPTAPDHLVFIGVVVRATNNGIIYVATQNGYELDELHNVSLPSPNSGEFLKYNGTLWVADAIDLGTDTTGNYMSGISGTSPVSVTHTAGEGSSATVALASGYGDTQNPYASKTANYVLASPNGSAGVPTFRALVATDVPTLNQNTTGTAATVTGAAQTAITSVGTLTGLTIGGAGANRSITINAPSGYYAIQYFAINGTNKWYYEVDPAGTRWALVESGVAERIGVTNAGATFSGTVTATTFSGSGASLTSIPYSALTGTVPTWNQNTSGSAATLTTARTLWGQSFNGSAAISGSLTGVYDINTAASPISTIYASNWFRSTGSTGWYSETYGGGMYMVDTTFVRVYNSKVFYATGGIFSVDTATASTSGFQYLLRGTLYGNYAPFSSMREAKRNIETISNSGLLIDQLNPVTFQEQLTDQDDEISTAWKNADLEYGFIADEVAQVGTGHLAQYKSMDDGTLKPVGWSFHGVISVLVAEVKELRKRVTQLESTQ